MLILIVAGGPDKGRIFELLDETEVVLGREGDKVRLNDHKCSRRHARLTRAGGQWYIEDNRSRHGTHRNHQPVTGKTPVNDGDYIQVGSTVLVMATVPEEHLERLALIGSADSGVAPVKQGDRAAVLAMAGAGAGSDESEAAPTDGADADTPLRDGGRPADSAIDRTRAPRQPRSATGRVLGACAAAAAVLIALNIGLMVTSSNQNQQLREQLTAMQNGSTGASTAPKTENDQKLAAILAQLDERVAREAEEQRARDRVLGDILAAVATEPQDLTPRLEAILARLDQMPDHREQLTALAEAVKGQPDVAARLDALAAAIEQRPDYAQQMQALAAAVEGVPDYAQDLQAMAGAIEKLPDPTAQLATIHEQLEAGAARGMQLPEGVAEQLDAMARQSRANAQALAALEQKLEAENDDETQAVMARIDKTLTQMLDQVQAPAEPADREDPVMLALAASQKQNKALFEDVIEQLKDRPTTEQMVARLREQLDGADGERSQQTQALFEQVLAELKKQPTAEQLAERLEAVHEADTAGATQMLGQIMAKVEATEAIAPRLDELTRLVAASREDDEDVQPVLADMLATMKRVDQRLPDNGPLLKAIADLRVAIPAADTDKLDAALAKLEAVPDDASLDALAAEVKKLAAAQRQALETQALLGEVLAVADAREQTGDRLARIESLLIDQPQQTRDALDAVLAKLDEALAQEPGHTALASAIEEIRATVRGEVRAELRAERIAAEREQQPRAQQGGERRTADAAAPEDRPRVVPEDHHEAGGDGLSRTERAYKLAFESGEPVRIGGHTVNSATGRVTEGRTVDPAAARAAGITDWRDWYLMDDFAERMRMQKQAMRYQAGSSDDAGVVGLPSAEPTINASIDRRKD